MKNYRKLVSVVILSYHNFKFIFDALKSVFQQDYNNLQIVISNDGSPDFDEEKLNRYIEKNKTPNISSIIINNNIKNMGTVYNFNKAIKLSEGEYITFLAADDMLSDIDVISSFIDKFEESEESVQLIHSSVRLFDLKMENAYKVLPTENDKEIFLGKSPNELYNELVIRGCYYPTTCCLKRDVFKIIGYVDERVKYIEDWLLYLNIYKNNIDTIFMDKITLNHRDGGICHGGDNYSTNLNQKFADDELVIMKMIYDEIDLLTVRNQKRFKKKYKQLKDIYFLKFGIENLSNSERRYYQLRSLITLIVRGGRELRHLVVAALLNDYFSIKYLTQIAILYIIYKILNISSILGQDLNDILANLAGFICGIKIMILLSSVVIKPIYHMYLVLKKYIGKFMLR